MERSWGRWPDFVLRLSIAWLPAFQLADIQHSDWLAFSALIGHNYTLIYVVTMYFIYTLPWCIFYVCVNVITHFLSFMASNLSITVSILSLIVSIFCPLHFIIFAFYFSSLSQSPSFLSRSPFFTHSILSYPFSIFLLEMHNPFFSLGRDI